MCNTSFSIDLGEEGYELRTGIFMNFELYAEGPLKGETQNNPCLFFF